MNGVFKMGIAWSAKRLVCFFKGCKTSYQSGWNMPDDWTSPTYCDRCGACDDVYKYEDTPYRIIYKSDGLLNNLWSLWRMEL